MLRVLDSTSASPDASPGQFPYTVRWKHTVASILQGLQAASGPRCGTVGPAGLFVRPLRAGIEYDGGDVSHTVGVSLTLSRRYEARILVDRGVLQGGGSIVLVHMGGYLSL